MVEGQKSRVKDGETSALATLTRTTYQPALERRKELQCGNARVPCREKSGGVGCAQISAFDKSSQFARFQIP